MRHVIIGGDGFVGRRLAQQLAGINQHVVVADISAGHPDTVPLDIRSREQLEEFELFPEDIVYNVAARMLVPMVKRSLRREHFWSVNYHGTENILDKMRSVGCHQLINFTTDMVYGHTLSIPKTEEHPLEPIGEYGKSKVAVEKLCETYRKEGIRICTFRPRLIIGPGRLGILEKLFKLIEYGLPVPMIGSGNNPYQFVSLDDCCQAAILAWQKGVPNGVYNLGSDNPPKTRDLLKQLIKAAKSRSFLLPTPAPLVKLVLEILDRVNLPLMDPEQYRIADEVCIVDTSAIKRDLGWQASANDEEMLFAAYQHYKSTKEHKASR